MDRSIWQKMPQWVKRTTDRQVHNLKEFGASIGNFFGSYAYELNLIIAHNP